MLEIHVQEKIFEKNDKRLKLATSLQFILDDRFHGQTELSGSPRRHPPLTEDKLLIFVFVSI